MVNDSKRIELVSDREIANRASYIGLGLLASLIVGWGPLNDALFGNGSFQGALGRFVACVGVCVLGASSLGHLLDSAPKPEVGDDEGGEDAPWSSESSSTGADEPV